MQTNVSLQTLNTLRCPAQAEHYVDVTSPQQLRSALQVARERVWPVTVLGEGSNVVLGDQLPGLILAQRSKGIEITDKCDEAVRINVAAGENWHRFVGWCLQHGYHGLENLALIPGTVGAAPIQNIGAYGVEVSKFIESVQFCMISDGRTRELSAQECEFGYRDSVFKHALRDATVIESVVFRLPKVTSPVSHYPSLQDWLARAGINDPSPQQLFDAVVAIRQSRLPDPASVPNVGSFFKNPVVTDATWRDLHEREPDLPHYPDAQGVKLPAAWFIDQCGFKQRSDRAVRVHSEHALVITNPEGHSASEIQALAEEIQAAVRARFGIELEQEPRSYGVPSA